MDDYRFIDDREFVRFRCLEVAADVSRYKSADDIIETARKFERFIMPKATLLRIANKKKKGGGKGY